MIVMIAAADQGSGIGLNGTIPWHLSSEMHHFKETTTGHLLVMGRKTFESIGHPLKDRHILVLTANPNYRYDHPDVTVLNSLDQIFSYAADQDLYICGGSHIYQLFMPFADRILLSRIPGIYHCDTFFPLISPADFDLAERIPKNGFVIEEYRRKQI